jgi:SAM-dependent methyltransferase
VGEAQIAAIQETVTASIRAYLDPPSGRAIYLGAGLGRHAFDGGRLFSSVLAVELSFAAAALLAAARAGTVRFASLSWLGADGAEDVVALHEAAVPPPPYGANVAYVVADALALPVADASADAVISIFFTDVAPASRLLPEVRRVLRPGGRFISAGPLLYHFQARAEQLTRAEMRYVLGEQGFDLEPGETTFALPCWVVPGSSQVLYRVWSFVATRRR